MELIVRFFRDTLTGFNYFVYALILLFLIFAIIGYLVTKNYQKSSSMANTKVTL